MFLEIRRDMRTGEVLSERMITKEELLKIHSNNYDIRGWAHGARKGSPFTILSKGLFYKKL